MDLEATLPKPIAMAAVIDQARRNLSTLLAVDTVPDLMVFVDRHYQQGVRTEPGRCLDAAGLAATVIGGPIPADETGLSAFEIDVPATGDGVWLMVIDVDDELGGCRSDWRAVFSPYRTCVGVAVANALALAVAQLADGEYLDEEIRMLRPQVHDPGEVINHSRLPEPGSDFAAQCEKYLRQFPDLNGWPRTRSFPTGPAVS